MFQAGIRAHFVTSRLAAPLLIENQGIKINLSIFAAQRNDKGVAYAAELGIEYKFTDIVNASKKEQGTLGTVATKQVLRLAMSL